jgi:hypothetical protein
MNFSFKEFKNTWEYNTDIKKSKDRKFSIADINFNGIQLAGFVNPPQVSLIELKLQWHLIIHFKDNSVLKYIAETVYHVNMDKSLKSEEATINLIKESLKRYSDKFDILKMDIGFTNKLPIVFTRLKYMYMERALLKRIYLLGH